MTARSSYAFFLVALALLASCAVVSGLADKETVDCPGGACSDGSTPPTGVDGSPDTPDSAPDSAPGIDAGFAKPDGWTLVAVTETTNGTPLPPCPQGFDDVSDIGTSPFATSGSCECASCTVTAQATCTGNPALTNGDGGVCDNVVNTSDPGGPYSNNPAGSCKDDMFAGSDRTGQYVKVKLKDPTGGACNPGAATPRPDKVDFSINRRRVCDETARCIGNLCDDSAPAPFAACLASPKGSGDVACPDGFSKKLVAGAADVTCNSSGCGCAVTRTPCSGTFSYYKDTACTTGVVTVAADDVCRNLNASGTYMRYKVVATTQTGCAGNGTATATVAPTGMRTVCCR